MFDGYSNAVCHNGAKDLREAVARTPNPGSECLLLLPPPLGNNQDKARSDARFEDPEKDAKND